MSPNWGGRERGGLLDVPRRTLQPILGELSFERLHGRGELWGLPAAQHGQYGRR